MTLPTLHENSPTQLHVVIELLNQTQGKEFAVLSRKNTTAIQNRIKHKCSPQGVLHSPSGKGSKKVRYDTATLKSFTKEEFLTNEKVQDTVLSAFRSGRLGIKTEEKHYAFNEERSREFDEAGIKTVTVTNTPSGEQVDEEASLDTISNEVYLMLLRQLSQLYKDMTHTPEKSTSTITTLQPFIHTDFKFSKKNAIQEDKHRALAKTSSQTKKQEEADAIADENSRAEQRKRAGDAEKKDTLASEKIRKLISSERLKEEIQNSTRLQELIKNGEINEALFMEILKKAEISEGAFFKLLQIAEIDEAFFVELLKKSGIDQQQLIEVIKKLNNEPISKNNALIENNKINEDVLNKMLKDNKIKISEAAKNILLSCANLDENSLNDMHQRLIINNQAYNKLIDAVYRNTNR